MNVSDGVLVAGASAAGLGTAEAPRRNGYRGRLTVVDAAEGLPYDRPPLSNQVLSGAWEPRLRRTGSTYADRTTRTASTSARWPTPAPRLPPPSTVEGRT